MRGFLFWMSVAYIVALVLFAVFGPLRYDVTESVGDRFELPSAKHWLGTDYLNRDVFARLAYGARVSLLIGVGVEAIAIVIGLVIGIAAGYGPRWLNVLLMRFTDGMFAFPDILLGILIIGVIGADPEAVFAFLPRTLADQVPENIVAVIPVMAALAVVAWPGLARLVRNQILSLKEQDFVIAARALGAPRRHVVLRHILPHLWGVVLAVAMVEMAMIILAESSLSFLGIGVQPPWPSWGSMINEARAYMRTQPLLLLWPCLLLSLTILALNFIGDGLRDRFDPRTARTIHK